MSTPSPAFTAILLGLSGCLVDFGSRTLGLALQRLAPNAEPSLEPPALTAAQMRQLEPILSELARDHAELTPGTSNMLQTLHNRDIPCAWLDELPIQTCQQLAQALPHWLPGTSGQDQRPWPAPDALWLTLVSLKVEQLDGCVLVSGEPRLLQAGLNAGLWTIGLAISGPLCGMALADWSSLSTHARDSVRSQATLSLYRLGVHSVIDQLSDLPTCLDDIALRRQKGEKP